MTCQTKAVRAEFCLLHYCAPGKAERTIGVLLLDPARDELWFRLRKNWDGFPEEDFPILDNMLEFFVGLIETKGGRGTIDWLTDTCSNVIQVTDPQELAVIDFQASLDELFLAHVNSPQ